MSNKAKFPKSPIKSITIDIQQSFCHDCNIFFFFLQQTGFINNCADISMREYNNNNEIFIIDLFAMDIKKLLDY